MRRAIGLSRRAMATAATGAATGAVVTAVVSSSSCAAPSLSGTYELLTPLEEPTTDETGSLRLSKKMVTGQLTYLSDGSMHTSLQDDPPVCYSGRWWTHPAETGGRPPHGNQRIVEHQVLQSSDPALVGKTVYQRISISNDGDLTMSDVRIVQGKLAFLEELRWRRMAVPS